MSRNLLLTAALFFLSFNTYALPLYELGIAAGAGYIPNYPASNEGRVRSLVLPNFRYRGKILRADQNAGVRANFYNYKFIDFDFSFGASFPVNSADSATRKEMEPLDWLLEFGPRALATLWHEPTVGRLRFSVPFRGVFSTDGTSGTYQGTVFVPGIIAEKFSMPCDNCRTLVTLGSSFTSRGVSDYFYGVDDKDVTPTRNQYYAKSGYLGTDLTVGVAYLKNSFQVFVGGRASSYAGAVNERSPLFKSRENLAGFFAIGWLFYQSKEEAKQEL